MSNDRLDVTFGCESCGARPTVLTLPEDYTNDSLAICKYCGIVLGKFGDIVAEAKVRAETWTASALRKSLNIPNAE